MRWIVVVLAVLSIGRLAAAAPPATPAAWAERLKAHYAHATKVTVTADPKPLHLGLCEPTVRPALEPGFARIALAFHDENLFQDAWLEIARVAPGVDVIAQVKAAKACTANKRYQVAIQAGDTLVLYHARCSEMATPFPYDLADLVAALEAEGATITRDVLANHCGSFEHRFTTVAAIKDSARVARKLYQHRFPGARDAFKQRRRAP